MATSGNGFSTHFEAAPLRAKPVRVLVVDDSAVVRQVLTRDLVKTGQIEVVGSAPDPYVARDMIIALKPQVLTLDLEMPRMDGITFIRKLMHFHPIPTIVLSSLTTHGSEIAVDALSAGAVDVMCKPGSAFTVGDLAGELIQRILIAAGTRVQRHVTPVQTARPVGLTTTTDKIIVLGASTGGVQALTTVLTGMPPGSPGIMVVQHMPARFTTGFANRLNKDCSLEVKEASSGDVVAPGVVLVAPGGKHMVLKRSGARYYADVIDGPEVHHQRPSVDVLFESVAQFAGANAIGAILTGMGADGAKGLLAMRHAGARTIAQDEASSVVYGMPGAAVAMGAVESIVPLSGVADALITLSRAAPSRRAS